MPGAGRRTRGGPATATPGTPNLPTKIIPTNIA